MASNRPLPGDLTVTGSDQASEWAWKANTTDLVNELQADHATNKTTIDESRTAILELIDDHDTNQTHLTNIKALLGNLVHRSQNHVIATSPALAISTNFDVANTETTLFVAGGIAYTLTDNTVCDTGTTKTLAASQWGAFAVEAANASTLTANWAANDYASEALALAAAKALTPTTAKCVIGYVTVQAHASGFTAGTDALTTGTGGNVANATNYYDLHVPTFTNVATAAEAALAAGDPTASAASLTNSTALTLLRA